MRLLSSEVPIRPLHLVVLIATLVALPPLLGACDGDVTVRANSICDGIQQATEDPVDAPFDLDGDGFYDDGNPQCAENYDADQLDCDDDDPDVNPDGTEVQCDGLDNDCDEETLDGEDLY